MHQKQRHRGAAKNADGSARRESIVPPCSLRAGKRAKRAELFFEERFMAAKRSRAAWSCHGEPIGRCHDTHPRPRATRKPRHCADEAHSAHRGFLGRAPQRNLLRDTEAPLRMLVDAAPHTRIKSIRFNRPKNKSIKSISGLRRRAFFGTT